MALTTTRFNSSAYLDSDEAVVVYMDEAFQTRIPLISRPSARRPRARHDANRQGCGMSRESLYRA